MVRWGDRWQVGSELLISGGDQEADQEADQEQAIRDEERTTGADGNPEHSTNK